MSSHSHGSGPLCKKQKTSVKMYSTNSVLFLTLFVTLVSAFPQREVDLPNGKTKLIFRIQLFAALYYSYTVKGFFIITVR